MREGLGFRERGMFCNPIAISRNLTSPQIHMLMTVWNQYEAARSGIVGLADAVRRPREAFCMRCGS